MITALSAYKAMIEASTAGNTGQKLETKESTASPSDSVSLSTRAAVVPGGGIPDTDSIDISASQDVFTAVDNFFNLGKSNRFDDFHKLSREDKETFVKIVAELAKAGYMGYEELVVNKKVERHEVLDKVVDQRLRGSRVYDNSKDPHR